MGMEHQHPTELVIGMRLSAALDDPEVCEKFKQEIRDWIVDLARR